jgi:hypothetical protein
MTLADVRLATKNANIATNSTAPMMISRRAHSGRIGPDVVADIFVLCEADDEKDATDDDMCALLCDV